MKNLIVRAITGIFLVVALIGLTILGKTYLLGMTIFLSLVGLYEFFNVIKKLDYKPNYMLGFIFTLIILAVNYLGYHKLESTLLIIYTFIIMIMMTFFDAFDLKSSFMQLFVIMYIPMSFSRIILLSGSNLIWLIYICSWGTDTFAYLTGSLIGKHKLIERLSPKKSIEGAIGGIVGCLIITLIYFYFLELPINALVVIFIIISSIAGQIGDLIASKIKRVTGIKDYAKLLPGHGGILDRFDSTILVIPFVYILQYFLF